MKYSVEIKLLLVLISLLLNGCACVALSNSNEEFKDEHQRSIEFASSSVPAEYLGKIDGAYVYEVADLKNQKVIFRLPATDDKQIEISLDNVTSYSKPGKPATFHFNKENVTLDTDSDFPMNVDIYTASMQSGFSYTCKDGRFHNDIDKSIKEGITCGQLSRNCHGLSLFDSSILGLRKTGYLVAVPLDIASLPVVLPFAVIFAFTWCGPFGCP
uniref:Uncharacterized protein n=1 Tax=Geobacter metallireducens TaxID=28232 RepID=A0A831U2K2_GEOME